MVTTAESRYPRADQIGGSSAAGARRSVTFGRQGARPGGSRPGSRL